MITVGPHPPANKKQTNTWCIKEILKKKKKILNLISKVRKKDKQNYCLSFMLYILLRVSDVYKGLRLKFSTAIYQTKNHQLKKTYRE